MSVNHKINLNAHRISTINVTEPHRLEKLGTIVRDIELLDADGNTVFYATVFGVDQDEIEVKVEG